MIVTYKYDDKVSELYRKWFLIDNQVCTDDDGLTQEERKQVLLLNVCNPDRHRIYRFNHIHMQILEFCHKDQKSPESIQRFEKSEP